MFTFRCPWHTNIRFYTDLFQKSKSDILNLFLDDQEEKPGSRLTIADFRILCKNSSSACHLSWAPIGQAMIRANTTNLWLQDSLDVFLKLDELFGKNHKTVTNSFTMFGRYENIADVLFHDETQKFRTVPVAKDTESMKNLYDTSDNVDDKCVHTSGSDTNFSLKVSTYFISFYLGTYFISIYV